jgi:mRNA-degrading endonuclease RelE of RelBE toxin-antitoxin system
MFIKKLQEIEKRIANISTENKKEVEEILKKMKVTRQNEATALFSSGYANVLFDLDGKNSTDIKKYMKRCFIAYCVHHLWYEHNTIEKKIEEDKVIIPINGHDYIIYKRKKHGGTAIRYKNKNFRIQFSEDMEYVIKQFFN